MADAGERLVRRWRRYDGRQLDIALEMTRVTLDVLERTIFTEGVARDPDALGRAITRYFEALGPIDPLDVFGFPDWIPRLGRWRARPAIRFFEETVGELIDGRRALIERGGTPPRDILTLLLEAADPETGQGLGDVEVRANIVTFIGAGHETTANALSWSLYLLSQAQDVRERVEREVDAVLGERAPAPDDLARLVFTRAVIDEAVRLYPPVPFMSRAALAEDRIGNMRIPKGSLVVAAPWVLHRHRLLWEAPEAFDPDRFMPGPARRHRPLRLSAVRGGAARLHRRMLCPAGGGDRAGQHRAGGPARTRRGPRGAPAAPGDAAPARRPAHAHQAATEPLRIR